MAAPSNFGEFISKWSPVTLAERAASQEHFIDLCRLLGQPTPAEHDATGAEYTFEKGVAVTAAASAGSKGEYGFADAWWRGKFAWEYKRKDKYKSLAEAYRQLCQYREALENPPLLIVSDIARTEIHTNFTGTRKEVHTIELAHIAHPDNIAKLRRVFTDPNSFKPSLSTYALTENAAAEFAKIADQLRQRGHNPHDAAHFLMKCMFCLFAEDVGLLPNALFSKLLERGVKEPDKLPRRLDELFAAMRAGGNFGVEDISYFNGGLFDDAPALPLKSIELQALRIAAEFDWSAVEPSIFGTLFERSLDPDKRSQIGAHYTGRDDIMLIVEPVVMAPLRREWEQVQAQIDSELARRRKAVTKETRRKADDAIGKLVDGFLHRLWSIRILDPACGSGNFLYVAIQELLALEKEVIVYASQPHIALPLIPGVRPTQLHGIELNPYAAELAQVVIWIGYLQWMKENGFVPPADPILSPLTSIENRDAILEFVSEPRASARADHPRDVNVAARTARRATWPAADFIIGNPPFLGSKLFRQYGLEDSYIQAMYGNFDIPNTSDLCCYWFELARQAVEESKRYRGKGHLERPHLRGPYLSDWPDTRVGLLATQGIRGGDNRKVLERIKQTGDIFMAWADREWILDGAAVHVSMVGFDAGVEGERKLDGTPVSQINSNLSSQLDAAAVRHLPENRSLAFIGGMKKGKFDIDWRTAFTLIRSSGNPHGRPNSEVLRPWVNGLDVTARCRGVWIVDFASELDANKAALYQEPFELVRKNVKPARDRVRTGFERERWWLHARPVPELRERLSALRRYVATPRVAKHRAFAWLSPSCLPDGQLVVFAREDDYFFGVLHSSVHELWARRMGTQLREAESGFRYTPTTCFETFPLPWSPGSEPRDLSRADTPRDVNVTAPEPRDSSRAATPRDVNVAAHGPRASARAADPHNLTFGAAYLLTWTTYGSWLPGDERGFVGRVPDQAGGHTIHNTPGEPYDVDDAHLRDAARARMKASPVTLDRRAAETCQAAFVEVANRYNVGIHAAAVMRTHVHLVVATIDAEPARLLNLFKGVSSRRLGQALGVRAGGSWWTRGGSYRSLLNDRALREATRYVCAQPGALTVFDHAPEPRASARADTPRDVNVAAPEPRDSSRAGAPRDMNVAARLHQRISAAARELNEQRERWLNPPEWIADLGRYVDGKHDFSDVPAAARELIRWSAIMDEAARDPRLKKRTLTNLYNERPTWLRLAHEQLDRAVLAAYAHIDPEGGWSEDWAAVWLDTGAGQPLPADHPLAQQRQEIDQTVLANLLRLNLARAAHDPT